MELWVIYKKQLAFNFYKQTNKQTKYLVILTIEKMFILYGKLFVKHFIFSQIFHKPHRTPFWALQGSS